MGVPRRRKRLACAKCGHEWYSFVSSPEKCPSCFTPRWRREERLALGLPVVEEAAA